MGRIGKVEKVIIGGVTYGQCLSLKYIEKNLKELAKILNFKNTFQEVFALNKYFVS